MSFRIRGLATCLECPRPAIIVLRRLETRRIRARCCSALFPRGYLVPYGPTVAQCRIIDTGDPLLETVNVRFGPGAFTTALKLKRRFRLLVIPVRELTLRVRPSVFRRSARCALPFIRVTSEHRETFFFVFFFSSFLIYVASDEQSPMVPRNQPYSEPRAGFRQLGYKRVDRYRNACIQDCKEWT